MPVDKWEGTILVVAAKSKTFSSDLDYFAPLGFAAQKSIYDKKG